MSTDATHRAVLDVLGHGLRGDLVKSAVGVELGAQLQSALTADVAAGATPAELLVAIREACGQVPVAYARVLELVVLAGLDELQILAVLPETDLSRGTDEPLAPAPPRRSPRRRR